MARCTICGKPMSSAEAAAYRGRHEDCSTPCVVTPRVDGHQYGDGARLYLGLAASVQLQDALRYAPR